MGISFVWNICTWPWKFEWSRTMPLTSRFEISCAWWHLVPKYLVHGVSCRQLYIVIFLTFLSLNKSTLPFHEEDNVQSLPSQANIVVDTILLYEGPRLCTAGRIISRSQSPSDVLFSSTCNWNVSSTLSVEIDDFRTFSLGPCSRRIQKWLVLSSTRAGTNHG